MQEFFLNPYFIITTTIWATYCYVLKCGFVSDDILGILNYDGKLQGLEYGMISRWLRYHIAGGNFPSSQKIQTPDGKVIIPPQGKIPLHHHVLILSVFTVAALLTYHFLQNIIGAKLALFSMILFCVHPVGVQAIAWNSALGYPLSLFWISSIINLMQWLYTNRTPEKAVIATIAFVIFQFLGIHAQFIPMMVCVILWFLGYKIFAVLGAIISAVMLFDIIKQTVKIRADEFKKQLMGESTHLSPRKFIVAMKTFLYYLGLTVAPRKLGLYHKWGFHYTKDLERIDGLFILGFLAFAGLIGIFFLCPYAAIKFAILWFIAFSFIFLNWITIQQFVTERYIFIPTLGTCIILSFLTQNYLWVYSLIFGMYLCRTWMHLPTYDNEVRFYQSNTWNFPDSEVALGNLGVAYLNAGFDESSLGTWKMATVVNPQYDVPWYNIFSSYKTKGITQIQNGEYAAGMKELEKAYPYLLKTLECEVCHFPEMWGKERDAIRQTLQDPTATLRAELNRLRVLDLSLRQMLAAAPNAQRSGEIQISVTNNSAQIKKLISFMEEHKIQTSTQEALLKKLFK